MHPSDNTDNPHAFSLCPHCGTAIAQGFPTECPECHEKIIVVSEPTLRGFFIYALVGALALVTVLLSLPLLRELIATLK